MENFGSVCLSLSQYDELKELANESSWLKENLDAAYELIFANAKKIAELEEALEEEKKSRNFWYGECKKTKAEIPQSNLGTMLDKLEGQIND